MEIENAAKLNNFLQWISYLHKNYAETLIFDRCEQHLVDIGNFTKWTRPKEVNYNIYG